MRPGTIGVATVAFAHRGHDWIRGSEQCLLDLVARLDRSVYRPVVICDAPTLAREMTRLDVQVVRIDDWGDAKPIAEADVRRRVLGFLREHRVDLVHANVTSTIPPLLPAVRRLRVPLVAHMHMPMPDRTERLFQCVHQATVAVGVAASVVEPLIADGMHTDRVRVILNAVDDERLSAGDATRLRADLGIPAEAVVAASVGSLIDRKGHDVTIEGVALARQRGVDVRLLVCGDGERAVALRELVAARGIADAVHFLGYRADVGAVLRDAADICVSSAREEALPLNVLEAQWLGVPVIGSDIAGHREALGAGPATVLVPPENPDAIATALIALAGDAAGRRAMSEAGRTRARALFAMERYVGDFEKLYASLLARPRGAYGWMRGGSWPRAYNAWLGRVIGRRLGRRPGRPTTVSA